MTVGQLEQLLTPATPVALLLFGLLGFAVWWVVRRLSRTIGRVSSGAATVEKRLSASIGRIGERVGDLERDRELERVRRFQLEATLRSRGIALPPWPDDPWPTHDDEEDQDDAYTAEAPRIPSLPDLPAIARHRR